MRYLIITISIAVTGCASKPTMRGSGCNMNDQGVFCPVPIEDAPHAQDCRLKRDFEGFNKLICSVRAI